MRIHTGINTDRPFRVHQAANDWFSVDFLDEWGGAGIVGVQLIECTREEWDEIVAQHGARGGFLSQWVWREGRLEVA